MDGAVERGELSKRSEKILETAIRVFARDGFAQADVQSIADDASVGKGTIYRHFGSKEGLFLAAAKHVRDQVHSEADAKADTADNPIVRLRRGIKAFVEYFHTHPETVELLIQERASFRDKTPTLFEESVDRDRHWLELFQQLIDDGTFRQVTLPQVQAILSRFVLGAMFSHYFGAAKHISDEDKMIDLLLHGLMAGPASPQD